MSETENNKRIAKNTILLYFRMLLMMLVSLYTSRVVLSELGVENFGIYNLLAGVVVLFSFLSNSMVSATQRYLSVAIGRKDENNIQEVFSASLCSHLILIFIVLIISETVALWFVNTQLDIPEGREYAANVIYQIAVVTTCINIIRVPYNASIIAYERMSFFAYISIAESILKLVIVWLLAITDGDVLINYSLYLLAVTIFINLLYTYYCNKQFKSCRFVVRFNKKMLVELTTFSGWNLFGGIADVGFKQGTNIILNIFHGVTVNAAVGIMNQVRTAVFSFIGNLQTAANPQIIKSYAVGDHAYFESLIFRISRYSYFLMIVIVLPLIFNIDLILNIWLDNPPVYSNTFVVISLIYGLIDSLTGPQWVAMQACGKLKKYQVVVSIVLLLNLPLSYIALRIGYAPYSVLVIQTFMCCITLMARLLFTKHYLNISVSSYARRVVWPILLVTIAVLPLSFLIYYSFDNYLRLLLFLCYIPFICLIIYGFGTSNGERNLVNQIIKTKVLSRF